MTTTSSCNIAVIAACGLGDGLVLLVLAHNLQRQGHHITFYNNPVAELQNWLPQLTVKPYPKPEDIEQCFANYDLVIAEPASIVTQHIPKQQYPHLAQHYVFVGLGTLESSLAFDHHTRLLTSNLDPDKAKQLASIARLSGLSVPNIDRTQSLVNNIATACQTILGIPNATKHNGLTPPSSVIYRKYSQRVIIHPLSTGHAKNWPAKKFMRLAKALQQQGWQPVFTVSPAEREQWMRVVKDKFPVPLFPTIETLASFVAESGFMIGNDSGTGHLASNLGIPTLTIRPKTDKFFRWLPGWAAGKHITPLISFKVSGKRYWKPFLSVKRVLTAFNELTKISATTLINDRNALLENKEHT
jgi:heptosyltransferase III